MKKKTIKGFIVSKTDVNRPKDRSLVYLESHATAPVWKPDRKDAKVFESLDAIDKFIRFWKQKREHLFITEVYE